MTLKKLIEDVNEYNSTEEALEVVSGGFGIIGEEV